jgi:hypothetical protein
MIPDNSPRLGGQSDDLSPMISSMGTKIIADARGAYLAGNLDALIEAMREDQRLDFKMAMLRQAYTYFQTSILQVPAAEPEHPILYQLAEQIGMWLQQSGHIDSGGLRSSLDSLMTHPQTDQERNLYILIEVTADLHLDLSPAAIKRAAHLFNRIDLPVHHNARHVVMHQWHLDLAWSILGGLRQPGAPSFDEYGAKFQPDDLHRVYHYGNLAVLTSVMTQDQLNYFRSLILTEPLRLIEHLPIPAEWQSAVRAQIRKLRRWLRGANEPTPGQYYKFTVAMNLLHDPDDYRLRAISVAGQALRLLTRDGRMLEGNAAYGAHSAALAIAYASASTIASHQHEAAERASRNVDRWHLELAWAILNDTPIPPLELEA